MNSAVSRIVILLVAALALSSCISAPVYNVSSATMASSPDAKLEQVAEAIMQAGLSRGWQMTEKGPSEMEGRLKLRWHVAVVSITFDTKQFSIFYKDSNNLKYDGSTIDSNYNGWIQDLEKAILAQSAGI